MTALVSGKLREYYESNRNILFFCNHAVFSPHGVILGKKRLIFRRKSLPFLGRGSYVRILDDKKFVEDFLSMSRSSAKKCKLFSFGKQAFLAKDDTDRGECFHKVHFQFCTHWWWDARNCKDFFRLCITEKTIH